MNKEKKERRKIRLQQFGKASLLGLFQGGVSAGITYLILRLYPVAVVGVVAIWLLFGWFSTYLINLNTFEIIVLMLSAGITSGLILYFTKVVYWMIALVIGLSFLSWTISFVTKVLLFPKPPMDPVKKHLATNTTKNAPSQGPSENLPLLEQEK